MNNAHLFFRFVHSTSLFLAVCLLALPLFIYLLIVIFLCPSPSFRADMTVPMQLICTLVTSELMNRQPDNIKIIVSNQ